MSLRYGILGMLSKWEASGYDIKKEFDEYMSIFWHSHLSQIYPELNKLEKDELISSQLVQQDGKPDKKMYSITETGRKELMSWLLSTPETIKMKDPFLMQTFFMDNIPADEVLLKLKMYKKERQQRLDQLKAILKNRLNSIKERNVMKSRILMSSAVLKRGIEQEIQYLKWCDETIELVEKCKFLWDREEATRIEHLRENKEIQFTASATFTEIEDIFLEYFAGILEEK